MGSGGGIVAGSCFQDGFQGTFLSEINSFLPAQENSRSIFVYSPSDSPSEISLNYAVFSGVSAVFIPYDFCLFAVRIVVRRGPEW